MTEEQKANSKILDEFQALGQQLVTAVRSLWESEESRDLRQEISDGFVELGQQLESAVKSAQESEAAKQFGEQVKATMDKARESDIAGKVEEGLVAGLQALNNELSGLVRSLETRGAGKEEPGDQPEA